MAKDEFNLNSTLLDQAFTGENLGKHRLTARIHDIKLVRHPIHAAPELAMSYLWVSGHFFYRDDSPCGEFHRYLYQDEQSDRFEAWLHWMQVADHRRGGLRDFRRQGVEALSAAGFRPVRTIARGINGAYLLGRELFELDEARLRGFGAGVGVAKGDLTEPLPQGGALVEIFVERVIAAALADGRISEAEARTAQRDAPRTLTELAAFEGDLSKRLLRTVRCPAVLEISEQVMLDRS